jgi:hypothetical protein
LLRQKPAEGRSPRLVGRPLADCAQRLGQDVGIPAPALGRDVKGVIGAVQQLQGRQITEAVDRHLQQVETRELIARTLQKEQWDPHLGKVLGALDPGLGRRV